MQIKSREISVGGRTEGELYKKGLVQPIYTQILLHEFNHNIEWVQTKTKEDMTYMYTGSITIPTSPSVVQ